MCVKPTFVLQCIGECQLGDKMRKHGNVVLTLAVTWHFYRTCASHEQLQKQWLYALLDDLVHKL